MTAADALMAAAISLIPTIVVGIIGYLLKRAINAHDADILAIKNQQQKNSGSIKEVNAVLPQLREAAETVKTLHTKYNEMDLRLHLLEQSNEDFKIYLKERFDSLDKNIGVIASTLNDDVKGIDKKLETAMAEIRKQMAGMNTRIDDLYQRK